jgi:hypothetical protein
MYATEKVPEVGIFLKRSSWNARASQFPFIFKRPQMRGKSRLY